VRNHRQLESRIHARLAAFKLQAPLGDSQVVASATPHVGDAAVVKAGTREIHLSGTEGGPSMLKVLVPVDGSPNALRAVRHAIDEYRRHHELELHLLNVQTRLSRQIGRFINADRRDQYYREQADLAVQPAQAALDAAKVPYQTHRVIGQDRARSIVETAQQLACHHLVMGTARKNSLTRMVEDSVTSRVLELTTVPVEVISGGAVSKIERIGLMAFVALGIAIVVLAVY
jgi:nucleotide-binding universal stress UspA family protein